MEQQGPEQREPDLSALADRLSGDASRGGPTLPYEITARGTGRRFTAIGAAGAFALVTLWQSDRLPFQVVPDGVPAFLPFLGLVLILAFLPRAVRTRARAVVDTHGILVDGVPGERHGWHRPWSALAQVGWFPDADGRGATLALRPPAPAAPVIATLPVHGSDAQGEAGDVIARACAAHGVAFTDDPAAFDLDRGVRRARRRLSE